MRYLIDNYISASDSQKIGSMEDFTLLDFILAQEGKLENEDDKPGQESAAEPLRTTSAKRLLNAWSSIRLTMRICLKSWSNLFLIAKQRESFVNEWYRTLLKAEVEKYLPKWEKVTGLQCSSWQSKYMTTKWGTCNTSTRKIWLNLQLAKKPIECLEYVILHELVHLKIRNHGTEFVAEMNRYMQNWHEIRNQLNESKLDYLAPME